MNGAIRRRTMQNKMGLLPEELVECEYIEKSGYNKVGPYINTEIKCASDLRIVIKIQNDAPYNSNTWPAIFGARDKNNTLRFESYSNGEIVQLFTISGVLFNSQDYGNTLNIPHVIDINIDRLIYDGITYIPTVTGDKIWTSENPVYIGALNNVGLGFASNSVAYKLYYCRLYKGNELVRDYVPVYNSSLDRYGVYDFVTNTFSDSAGSYSFTGKLKN